MKIYILYISLILLIFFGKNIFSQDEALDLSELKELNTNSDEFSPIFTDSVTMIFTSSARNPLSEKVVANHHNMYVSNYSSGQWTEPKRMNYISNSDNHEASVGISTSKQTLYVYKTYNGGDIYSSIKKDNGRWSPLKRMSYNTQYHECSASNCNNIVYFVSDKPEGKGKHDIYYTILENGKWSKPENLTILNTELDENHVFVSNDCSTLYFSSKGHNSVGGYDIYKSVKDESDNWTSPVSMGESVNTKDNEISFSQDINSNIYFSSDRPNENAEGYNIYYNKEKKIKLKVPLLLLGIAPIEQAEIAKLSQVKDSVEIYGYKQDLPKYFEVDISEIEDTTQLSFVGDLIADKKVEILDDPKDPIYEIKPIFKKKKNLDWEEVKEQIDIDVRYCKVQVGTFSQLRSVIDFNEKFPLLGDKVMMISSENYTRYLMRETFTDIDTAAMLQKRCLYEYHSVPDTFIAVYDGKGNRRIIYFNLDTEKYMLLKPEEQTRDIFSID